VNRGSKSGYESETFARCVADPNPDPPDPHVFGPPGSRSGSISQKYGSRSFYHLVKIVRKALIYNVLCLLFDFLSLKNDVNVP
jgi:hypothetical protein